MLNIEQLQKLGMNRHFDKSILPEQYRYQFQPFYRGDGELNVKEMEGLLNKFKEYVHQQDIIKEELIKHILEKEVEISENNTETNHKKALEQLGFYSDILWTVSDVKGKFSEATDEQAQHILDKALNNEATMEQIWFSINEFATDLYNLTEKEDETI